MCPEETRYLVTIRLRLRLHPTKGAGTPARSALGPLGFGGVGFWVLGFGFWVLGVGCWVLGFGFWVLGLIGFRGLGFRVSAFRSSGFRVQKRLTAAVSSESLQG